MEPGQADQARAPGCLGMSAPDAGAAHDVIAHQSISNCLSLHSRGVDRASRAMIADAYHDGATVDYGFFQGPAAELADILAGAQADTPPTLHRTSNMWIRVDGDRAVSESYVIAYVGQEGAQRLVFGRYLDRHALVEGQWRIAHRTYVLDANINRPDTSLPFMAATGLADFGARGGKQGQDVGTALLNHHRLVSQLNSGGNPVEANALDAACSRLAILDLSNAYARGVDRGDAALLRTIFHDDAVVMCGIANGDGVSFPDAIVAHCRQHLVRCFHSMSNSWVEVHGDEAAGEHYVIALATAGDNDIFTGGRYIDRYERRDGVWKISSRSFVCDWTSVQPATFESDGFYGPLATRGSFDRNDPIYAIWPS